MRSSDSIGSDATSDSLEASSSDYLQLNRLIERSSVESLIRLVAQSSLHGKLNAAFALGNRALDSGYNLEVSNVIARCARCIANACLKQLRCYCMIR